MQFYTEESARAAGGRFPAAASQNCQFPPKAASKLCASWWRCDLSHFAWKV